MKDLPESGQAEKNRPGDSHDLDDACHLVDRAVTASLRHLPPGRQRVLAAFSGGPDSTALLWALLRQPRLQVFAVHVDHGLDAAASDRARQALASAERLGAACDLVELPRPFRRASGQSREESARIQRYRALREVGDRRGTDWLATGHHADDQAETVLLRALSGSRLRGLQAMQQLDANHWRPLLGLRRATLQQALEELGLGALDDPTNEDTVLLRNRVRHLILPRLRRDEGDDLTVKLCTLAQRGRSAFARLDRWLDESLQIESDEDSSRLDLERWLCLPESLQEPALERLHRRFGHRRPASHRAFVELRRQLASRGTESGRGNVACDCGNGLRWRTQGRWLKLERAPRRKGTAAVDFTYTVQIPGRFRIPEISASILIERSGREPQTARSPGCHAVFNLPPNTHTLTIRNRRPGDRAHYRRGTSRRLKRLLAELAFPAPLRARLPLLCDRHRILWIPGLLVHPDYKAEAGASLWRASFEPDADRAGISDWTEALQRLAPARAAALRHLPS